MSFTTLIKSAQGETYAAAAFLDDGAVVVSLDPQYDSVVDSWQTIFNSRVRMFKQFIDQSENKSEGVLGACLYNNLLITDEFQSYNTDQEALDAVYQIRGLPS